MHNIDIQIGSYEVYAAGCVTSVENSDALFRIVEGISIRVHFIRSNDSNQSMNTSINEHGELQFNLTNFNNPLGTEFTNPIPIGTLNGRRLLLHLKVLGMENSNNRTLIYTWLLGEAINNG